MDTLSLLFGAVVAIGGLVVYELYSLKEKIGSLEVSEDTAVKELREIKGLLGMVVDYLRKIEGNTEH